MYKIAGAISLFYFVWAVFQMEQSEIAGCMKYVAQSQMNYEQLLPMYRLMYRVGQRFTGELISNAENEKILEETEKLFGGKKRASRDWCQSTYDRKNFFFQRKELARIQANKEIRLFECGYVGECSFKFALKTKWLVYTLTAGIIMLPTVLAIRTFS